MQIVIDIPNTLKEIIDAHDIITASHFMWVSIMMDAIENGTPLPKGHGRLIDADELKKIWNGCKFVGSIDCLVDCRPTIIEADKEEE